MSAVEFVSRCRLAGRVARFSERELPDALSDARRLGLVTILGDHDGEEGEFWNVSPDDAAVLELNGYERA